MSGVTIYTHNQTVTITYEDVVGYQTAMKPQTSFIIALLFYNETSVTMTVSGVAKTVKRLQYKSLNPNLCPTLRPTFRLSVPLQTVQIYFDEGFFGGQEWCVEPGCLLVTRRRSLYLSVRRQGSIHIEKAESAGV